MSLAGATGTGFDQVAPPSAERMTCARRYVPVQVYIATYKLPECGGVKPDALQTCRTGMRHGLHRAVGEIVLIGEIEVEARRDGIRVGERAGLVALLQFRAGSSHERRAGEAQPIGCGVGGADVNRLAEPEDGRVEQLRRSELRPRRQRAAAEIIRDVENGVAAERGRARDVDVGRRVRQGEVQQDLA